MLTIKELLAVEGFMTTSKMQHIIKQTGDKPISIGLIFENIFMAGS